MNKKKSDRVLCIIPARGGSKGIPGKNLKEVGGYPLVSWVCNAVKKVSSISKVILSTDAPEIAETARSCGVEVPSLRKASLAKDKSLVVDVLIDELEKAENADGVVYDFVCLLQATSPFVDPQDIESAIQLACQRNADTVISVYDVGQKHPEIMLTLGKDSEVEWFCDTEHRMARRQELPEVYARSGLVYVIRRDVLLERRSLYGDKVYAIKVDATRALSIDTESDLVTANSLVESGYVSYAQEPMPKVESETGGDFESRWKGSKELGYVHWTSGRPENQIQLAFRNHWELFCEIIGRQSGRGMRALEPGCGRGSMSCYFSSAGYDCTLLDNSPTAIDQATRLFEQHGLKAKFDVGDALAMPYEDETFDVVYSIGLLEHFSSIDKVLAEQVRVLKRGGVLLVYVVPEKEVLVQEKYEWVNSLLHDFRNSECGNTQTKNKPPMFRTRYGSQKYVDCLKRQGMSDVKASGVYPLPMISFSKEFPFSLMPPQCEKTLVTEFENILKARRKSTGQNPWLCPEAEGQAFLVWGNKC